MITKNRNQGRNNPRYKHGLSKTSTYTIWIDMKRRCFDRKKKKWFSLYGARGITVCVRWLKFENFIADMGMRPSEIYTLERINNDGNYCPQNCKWVTRAAQGRNTRRVKLDWTKVSKIKELRKTGLKMKVIAEKFGVHETTIERVLAQTRWNPNLK